MMVVYTQFGVHLPLQISLQFSTENPLPYFCAYLSKQVLEDRIQGNKQQSAEASMMRKWHQSVHLVIFADDKYIVCSYRVCVFTSNTFKYKAALQILLCLLCHWPFVIT